MPLKDVGLNRIPSDTLNCVCIPIILTALISAYKRLIDPVKYQKTVFFGTPVGIAMHLGASVFTHSVNVKGSDINAFAFVRFEYAGITRVLSVGKIRNTVESR